LYERSVLHAQHGSVKKVLLHLAGELICEAIDGFLILLRRFPMDMTVTRDLAKLYNANGRNRDAVQLYEDAKTYYGLLPQESKPDGDLNTPFDWYPPTPPIPVLTGF
jgi:hypothetical protein